MRRLWLMVVAGLCATTSFAQIGLEKPKVSGDLEPLVRELLKETHANDRVAASLRMILSFESFASPAGVRAADATFDQHMTDALNRAQQQQNERHKQIGKLVLKEANLDDAAWYVYAPLYAEGWSAEDLKGLITFYASPLGQKVITRDPQFHFWEQARTLEFFGEKLRDARKLVRREELLKTNPARVTSEDMRSFATALEQYAFEHNEAYPTETDPLKLQKLVGPPDFPMVDAWGTPFRFVFSTDRRHYRVISAGSDKEFAGYTKAWGSKPDVRNEPGVDIVYEDGLFVLYPPGAIDQSF